MLVFLFFSTFLDDTSPFVGPLITLFWTSGDVFSGFQRWIPSLACFVVFVVISSETPADHLAAYIVVESILINVLVHICKHWWGLGSGSCVLLTHSV